MKSYQDSLSNLPEKKKKKKHDWNLVLDMFLFFTGIIGVLWYVITNQDNSSIIIISIILFLGIKILQLRR